VPRCAINKCPTASNAVIKPSHASWNDNGRAHLSVMCWRFVQLQSLETIVRKSDTTRALTQYEATVFQVKYLPICPFTYNARASSLPGCPPNNNDEVSVSADLSVRPAQAATLCISDGLTTLEMDRYQDTVNRDNIAASTRCEDNEVVANVIILVRAD
jgi:hypothetical protein